MKKTVSVICAAMMLASSASGCSSNNANVTSANKTSPTEEVTATAAYEAKHPLSNPNADENTQKVYDYICDSFGTYMLSCQQESTWMADGSGGAKRAEKTL